MWFVALKSRTKVQGNLIGRGSDPKRNQQPLLITKVFWISGSCGHPGDTTTTTTTTTTTVWED